jgi:hypothetical protein
MTFSFTSLIRLTVILALASVSAAIGVSRLDPPAPSWRLAQGVTHAGICGLYWGTGQHDARWLDLDAGSLRPLPIPDGESLDTASLSPWRDETGASQVVGRWSRKEPGTTVVEGLTNQFGLARYRYPSGERIDYVTTDVIPSGPVCWFPGTSAQVLFTGGDGGLYRFAFEPRTEGGEPDTEPLRLGFVEGSRIAEQLDGAFFCDLSWPSDPRLNGLALVSLRTRSTVDSDPLQRYRYSRGQIWWVRFNAEGTKVVAGGRLFDQKDSDAERDERSPVLGIGPDGHPLVTFKVKTQGGHGWDLRLARLDRERLSGEPLLSFAESRVAARNHAPCPSPISNDGRRVFSLTNQGASWKRPHLEVVPVEPANMARLTGAGRPVVARSEPGA